MSLLEWNILPVRRAGNRDLPPIPAEIYFEIFNYFWENASGKNADTEAKETLANLAFVCRYFTWLIVPRIFREVNFVLKETNSETEQKPNALIHFCKGLLDQKEPATAIAPYVKSCTLEHFLLSYSLDVLYNLGLSALSKLTELESLTLADVHINEAVLTALKQLNKLTSLTLIGCFFSRRTRRDDIMACARNMTPERLEIGPSPINRWDAWPQNFTSFTDHLDYHSLKTLIIYDPSITAQFAKSSQDLPSVETLSIATSDSFCLLLKLLAKTPNLRQLDLDPTYLCESCRPNQGRGDEPETPPPIFPSLVPKLQVIIARASSVVPVLAPTRPIKKVVVRDDSVYFVEQRCRYTLEALQRTSATVEELHVPMYFYRVDDIKAYLPNLPKLVIWDCSINWERFLLETNFFGHWSPNPSIRELGLETDSMEEYEVIDLRLQRQIVEDKITKEFPNVEKVTFINLIDWCRLLPDGGWRASVSKEK